MPKHGKKYRQAHEAITPGTLFSPLEAVNLIKDQELTRFDATVEVHFRLGVNVVIYALTVDYKKDQVHSPFIKERRGL